MKLSTQAILTAAGLLVLSAGALLPMRSKIQEMELGVSQLEAERPMSDRIFMDLEAIKAEIEDFDERVADRDFKLCPDTPEDQHAFESALRKEMQTAGLSRISMDRKAGQAVNKVPCFVISLVIEGGAFQLHSFLVGIESLEWVSRIQRLEVQQGDLMAGGDVRRFTMQIAVLLEKAS